MQNNFHIPFLNPSRSPTSYTSYPKALQTTLAPHFAALSLTSILLCANILIFVLMHILYKPSSHTRFLSWPSEMDNWLLDIELVKSNKKYLYQVVTALFMHTDYLHLLGNILFGLFIMWEIEFGWVWSIPMGLGAGVVVNFLAILTIQGRVLGFSTVLAAYTGMIVVLIISHIEYFQRRSPGSTCSLIFLVAMISFGIIGSGGITGSVVLHLYGYLIGMLFGLGFYPKHPESSVNPTCENIFKAISMLAVIAVVVPAILI